MSTTTSSALISMLSCNLGYSSTSDLIFMTFGDFQLKSSMLIGFYANSTNPSYIDFKPNLIRLGSE